MIVKILTHVHRVVNTCWCWHIDKGGEVWVVEKGLGSSLPPAKLARQDSMLFKKWNDYFFTDWTRSSDDWTRLVSSGGARWGANGLVHWPDAEGVRASATECIRSWISCSGTSLNHDRMLALSRLIEVLACPILALWCTLSSDLRVRSVTGPACPVNHDAWLCAWACYWALLSRSVTLICAVQWAQWLYS
jgi:hypothetical protein